MSTEIVSTDTRLEVINGAEGVTEIIQTTPLVEVIESGQQGTPGSPGSIGTASIDETPAGAVNGINATFITAFDFVPETVQVFLNGLALTKPGDYQTVGNDTILFAVSPLTGEQVRVNYFLL